MFITLLEHKTAILQYTILILSPSLNIYRFSGTSIITVVPILQFMDVYK